MATTTLTPSERAALENNAITAMQSGSNTDSFVHTFQGQGSTIDAHCGVTLFIDQVNNRAAVVLTEKPGNPGRSVTNAVEQIASEVFNKHLANLANNIPPGRVAWIEHYEKGLPASRPTFDRVLLGHAYNAGRVGFYAPDWKRLHG